MARNWRSKKPTRAGGYGGKPFKLMLHNDYDNWQAKAVYGDDRADRSEHLGFAFE